MKEYMKPALQVREIRIMENIAATATRGTTAYKKIQGKLVPSTAYSVLGVIDSVSVPEGDE